MIAVVAFGLLLCCDLSLSLAIPSSNDGKDCIRNIMSFVTHNFEMGAKSVHLLPENILDTVYLFDGRVIDMSPIRWHEPLSGVSHTAETWVISTGAVIPEVSLKFKCALTVFDEVRNCQPAVILIKNLTVFADFRVNKSSRTLTIHEVETMGADFALQGVGYHFDVNDKDAQKDFRRKTDQYITDLINLNEVIVPKDKLLNCE